MLGGIKRFIKSTLLTDSHPFLMSMYHKRQLRIMSSALAEYDAHSRMSYAEIESAVGSQYRKMFGRTLNWENPQTYNEKIHVSKIYMPDPIKTRLADKVAVREWITERIGSEYLIPLLGVYDSFDEIDFDALPDSFVIKCNHDSGSVTLVKDKSKINSDFLRRKYELLMRRNFAWMGWEMHYRNIPHKIMIERYMGDAISDYKFQCFNGEPYSCRVDYDRFGDHRRNVYDMDWKIIPFMKGHYQHPDREYPSPPEYEDMKRIVRELGRDIEQVRIDMYLVDGHIYFGEMTFTNADGFEEFIPDEWDYKLGELWPFDNTIRAKVLAKFTRPADYHP